MQKKNMELLSIQHLKINSKLVKSLKISTESIKTESIKEKLYYIELSKYLWVWQQNTDDKRKIN